MLPIFGLGVSSFPGMLLRFTPPSLSWAKIHSTVLSKCKNSQPYNYRRINAYRLLATSPLDPHNYGMPSGFMWTSGHCWISTLRPLNGRSGWPHCHIWKGLFLFFTGQIRRTCVKILRQRERDRLFSLQSQTTLVTVALSRLSVSPTPGGDSTNKEESCGHMSDRDVTSLLSIASVTSLWLETWTGCVEARLSWHLSVKL